MKRTLLRMSMITMIFMTLAMSQNKGSIVMSEKNIENAVVGGGCFWCVEAVFERVEGVIDVVSGYAGGHKKNPTYKEVTSGGTGHAEVCQIMFDKDKISYDEILDIFWEAHDPTTLNRQGNDRGTQYRSAIYYQGENQKLAVQKSIKKAEKLFDDPITTEVKELDKFYVAEGYHQDYFENNPNAPYCTFIIAPKINKLRKKGTIWEE